jgi:transposase
VIHRCSDATQASYWLSDTEREEIQPHPSKGGRGARRVDDRRVISGIMHMWERIFNARTGATGVFTGSVDSTHIKAHRPAAGAKAGLVIMPLALRAAAAPLNSTR